jgi:hypothetical protein
VGDCLDWSHLAGVVLDKLWRELLEHLLFGPSEDEWSDALLQALKCSDKSLGVFELLLHLLDVRS